MIIGTATTEELEENKNSGIGTPTTTGKLEHQQQESWNNNNNRVI